MADDVPGDEPEAADAPPPAGGGSPTGPDDGPTPDGPEGAAASTDRNSALVATGILLSRLTGLIRERTIGHYFGTGFAADAFTAAFRIPNLLQNLLGEGVLSASFIPIYARLLSEGREEEAGRVAGAIAGLLTVVAGGLVVLGVVFAGPLTALVAPGFTGRTYDLTVTLMRIITPGVGFLVLSAWCLGVLNSHRHFFLSYVAPVLWNVAQIAMLIGAGVFIFGDDLAGTVTDIDAQAGLVVWLAWGTVLGGLLQFAVQLPTVIRVTRELRPSVRTDIPGVRRVIRAFGPIVAGRGVVQLSAYVDIFLASFLAVGAMAALRYGQMLYLLPISLFGMAVAAAELPEMSSVAPEERSKLVDRLQDGMARIAFFVAPTTIAYLIIGDLVVGTIFQTGEFDALVTIQVWIVLGAYAVGLLASTASRLLQSALYGIGDPKTPAKVAALRVAISVALGVALMFQLDRIAVTAEGLTLTHALPAFGPLEDAARVPEAGELQRLGAAGLALAAGLAAWVEYRLLRRTVAREIGPSQIGGGRLRPMLLPLVALAVVAFAVRPVVDPLHPIVAGLIAVGAAGGAYVLTARMTGVEEAENLGKMVRRVLRR